MANYAKDFAKDVDWTSPAPISHKPFFHTVPSLAAATGYLIGPSTTSQTADLVVANVFSDVTISNQSATAGLRFSATVDDGQATPAYFLIEAGASMTTKGPFGRLALYNPHASAAATFSVSGRLVRSPSADFPSATAEDLTADSTQMTADESNITCDQTVLT